MLIQSVNHRLVSPKKQNRRLVREPCVLRSAAAHHHFKRSNQPTAAVRQGNIHPPAQLAANQQGRNGDGGVGVIIFAQRRE